MMEKVLLVVSLIVSVCSQATRPLGGLAPGLSRSQIAKCGMKLSRVAIDIRQVVESTLQEQQFNATKIETIGKALYLGNECSSLIDSHGVDIQNCLDQSFELIKLGFPLYLENSNDIEKWTALETQMHNVKQKVCLPPALQDKKPECYRFI